MQDALKKQSLYIKSIKISKDEYIIKEIAVCMYQEGTYQSYYDALNFLNKNIKIESTINPEVLKTLGTIYKNLWLKKELLNSRIKHLLVMKNHLYF